MSDKINSRTKGSKNERKVAKLFQEWTGYEFARTPQSGGLHWKKQHTVGDIVCIDERHGRKFPFSIECKFHQELDFSHLIDGTIGKGSNKVIHFWEQCLGDAETANKTPVLFMRRNRMKSDMHFVGIPSSLFLLLCVTTEVNIKFGYLHFVNDDYAITILNSEDFFNIDYKVIYKLSKKLNKDGKKEK